MSRPTFGVLYAGAGAWVAAEDAGRDPAALELIAGGARDARGAEALVELGVTHIVTSTRATGPSDLPASLDAYHQRVIAPLG